MNVLFTGASGYSGIGMVEILSAHHMVRGADVVCKPSACREMLVADITDYETCRSLVNGMDAMALCHMAPNPDGYKLPAPAFDVNVKGTANLYHAAAEVGLKTVVLISSCGVLMNPQTPATDAEVGVGPYRYGDGLYCLSKVMQEGIARHYFLQFGIATAVLRPSWIVYDGELVTKYGEKMQRYSSSLIDPRDIGRAIVAALALPSLKLESFNIGQDDLPADLTFAKTRLRWSPQHRFESLPRVNNGN